MFIKVKVFPNQKKQKIIKKSKDSFEIRVKQKAEKNQANYAVFRVLASYFNLPISCFQIIKGQKSKNKIFKINCKISEKYENSEKSEDSEKLS